MRNFKILEEGPQSPLLSLVLGSPKQPGVSDKIMLSFCGEKGGFKSVHCLLVFTGAPKATSLHW